MSFLLGKTRLPDDPEFVSMITAETYQAAKQERRTAWENLWNATRDAAIYRDNANGRDMAITEAYKRRNQAIQDATGVQLRNPNQIFDDGWLPHSAGPVSGETEGAQIERRRAALKADWLKRVDELRPQFPDHAALFEDNVPDGAIGIAQEAEQAEREAQQQALDAGLTALPKVGALLGGGLAGIARDPLQIASLFVGGGAGTGRTVARRILQVILTEGAINAGVETATQAAAHRWKREAGLDTSIDGSLRQIGLAALFGGGFGGLLQGGGEVLRLAGRSVSRETLERAVEGDPAAIETIAQELRVDVPQADRQALERASEQEALDREAFGPELTASEDGPSLSEIAVRAIEDDSPQPAFPPQTARPALSPDNFGFFRPDDLLIDAGRFQFKDGGDGRGVTARLRGVQDWNPERAGVIIVFEDDAGRQFVADGHQRTALATRIGEQNGRPIELPGYVFRAADGYSAEDVRTIAALKNVAEGSGSAIDAAKVLRGGTGGTDDLNLPANSALVRDAAGLARLSDDAFTMAVNEIVKPQVAAVVGRMVANEQLHAEFLSVLNGQGARTIGDAESMVGDLLSADTIIERQESLFGTADVQRMLLKERAKVRAAALNTLKKDKRIFAMLADEESRVTAAGNVLDTNANRERANADANLIEAIDRLSHTKGPIADAFNAAARSVAGGQSAGRAARAFVGSVRDEIERAGGNLGRIGADGPDHALAQPENLAPSLLAEPASREAGDMADTALTEAGGPAETPDLLDMMPAGRDANGDSLHVSHADMVADANRDDLFADVIASCRE